MAQNKPKTREELIAQDVKDLHKMGYAQQLFREMGGFSNFAISFSIISILTGAMLLYGYGLKFAGNCLRLPYRRRPVFLGFPPGRRGLGLGDRLVEHGRPDHHYRRH
jgi:hypothetical protein